MSVPGAGRVLAFTIAAEIGEIERFSAPEKLTGYTGLCPRVNQPPAVQALRSSAFPPP
jgi:transposase